MEPYHNKGFGVAFLWIIIITMVLPITAMMTLDDRWDRVLQKYGAPWKSDCWENSKHERVCKGDNTCLIGRNFCIPEKFRWRAE